MMPNQPLDPCQTVPLKVVAAAEEMGILRLPSTRSFWTDGAGAACSEGSCFASHGN